MWNRRRYIRSIKQAIITKTEKNTHKKQRFLYRFHLYANKFENIYIKYNNSLEKTFIKIDSNKDRKFNQTNFSRRNKKTK